MIHRCSQSSVGTSPPNNQATSGLHSYVGALAFSALTPLAFNLDPLHWAWLFGLQPLSCPLGLLFLLFLGYGPSGPSLHPFLGSELSRLVSVPLGLVGYLAPIFIHK